MSDRRNTVRPGSSRTKFLTLTGLMTAVICIVGPLSLPLPASPVPVTLTNFAIYIAVYVLGLKAGTVSWPDLSLSGRRRTSCLLPPSAAVSENWPGLPEDISSDFFSWH